MTTTYRLQSVLAAVLMLTVTGCGGSDAEADRPPRLPVTGTVMYQSKPLAGAQVTFNSEDHQGQSAFGRTDEEGHYELTTFETGDGAVAGNYIVTITKYDTPVITDPEEPAAEEEYVPPEAAGAPAQAPPKNEAPEKYSKMHTSDLRAVVSDGGENTFDFPLAD